VPISEPITIRHEPTRAVPGLEPEPVRETGSEKKPDRSGDDPGASDQDPGRAIRIRESDQDPGRAIRIRESDQDPGRAIRIRESDQDPGERSGSGTPFVIFRK
jgi:hypothetical protein